MFLLRKEKKLRDEMDNIKRNSRVEDESIIDGKSFQRERI